MYGAIMKGKPKNWIKTDELTLEQATECFNKRREVMAEFAKQGDYKNLVEEVYMLIIANTDKDDEFEKMKIRAHLQSAIIKCKANDCMLHKYGYDELQIEEAIAKYGLQEAADKKWMDEKNKKLLLF